MCHINRHNNFYTLHGNEVTKQYEYMGKEHYKRINPNYFL